MIPHNRLTFDKKEEKAVIKVIKSGYWAGGKEVDRLERKIANITKRKYAIGVSSGLSALRLSLLALGINKNDEVIIPAYSCVAIPNAVLSCGAIPIPVDIIKNEWNIDFNQIKLKISSNTKAIICVNTFGLNSNIKQIQTLNIPIIEDCAHAIGEIENEYVFGKQSIIAIGSFYATKLVGGGEGGIVVTDDSNIANFIYDFRDYSDKLPSSQRLNEKMSNIDASLSLIQSKRLTSMVKKRQEIATYYNEMFSLIQFEFPELVIPQFIHRIWYRYIIYFRNINAFEAINQLKLYGVRAEIPIENWLDEKDKHEYPITSFANEHLVSLPIYPTLRKTEMMAVVEALKITIHKLF